ncbi:hypothetical protein Tco_0998666 [Tanacetum coccineum]
MGTPTQVCVRSCPNISAPAGRPFRCFPPLSGCDSELQENKEGLELLKTAIAKAGYTDKAAIDLTKMVLNGFKVHKHIVAQIQKGEVRTNDVTRITHPDWFKLILNMGKSPKVLRG